MTEFIIYVITTGLIRYTGTCQEELLNSQHLETGEAIMAGSANLFTDYILDGVVTARPTNPATIDSESIAADGVSAVTISSMPNPSVISFSVPNSVNSIPEYTDTDGVLHFICNTVGVYTITVQAFPCLDKVFTITAA